MRKLSGKWNWDLSWDLYWSLSWNLTRYLARDVAWNLDGNLTRNHSRYLARNLPWSLTRIWNWVDAGKVRAPWDMTRYQHSTVPIRYLDAQFLILL